ncbi:MAG TPA: hypothetical protein VKS21_04520 [Spirochaetota bacterium]|nr:hypothetical protein [Spirochaetota bacterium]
MGSMPDFFGHAALFVARKNPSMVFIKQNFFAKYSMIFPEK